MFVPEKFHKSKVDVVYARRSTIFMPGLMKNIYLIFVVRNVISFLKMNKKVVIIDVKVQR